MTCQLIAYNKKTLTYSTLEQEDEEGAQQVSTARIADARCGGTAAARREQRKEKHYKGRGAEKGGNTGTGGRGRSTTSIHCTYCRRALRQDSCCAARTEERKTLQREGSREGRYWEEGGGGGARACFFIQRPDTDQEGAEGGVPGGPDRET